MDSPLMPEELSVTQLIERLREMLRTVPAAYQQWPHGKVLDYKDAARKARILIDKRSTRRDFLLREYKVLNGFY